MKSNKIWRDHLGNEYSTQRELADAYGIKLTTLRMRLQKGLSIEDALTNPTYGTVYQYYDHLGNAYKTKGEMLQKYGIPCNTFNLRIKHGWTLEDALTIPIGVPLRTFNKTPGIAKIAYTVKGKQYHSIREIAEDYNINVNTFYNRLKRGMSIEEAIDHQNQRLPKTVCQDHNGQTFNSLKEMCSNWGISYTLYNSRINAGYSVEEALTLPKNGKKIEARKQKEFTRLKAQEDRENSRKANYYSKVEPNLKGIKIIGDYTSLNQDLLCLCELCGKTFLIKAEKLQWYHKFGCPDCDKEIKRIAAKEKAEERLTNEYPNVRMLGEFVDMYTKTLFECDKGHQWMQTPANVFNTRHGCPFCGNLEIGNKNRHSAEWFYNEAAEKSPDLEVLGDFNGLHRKIQVRCRRCGREWSTRAALLIKPFGIHCKICGFKTGTSTAEQIILEALRYFIGHENVISRDCETIGMELDILVPKLKLAIEPGDWAFHKEKAIRDLEKRERCNDLGIRLITIFENYPENLEVPYSDNCHCFSFDLVQESNQSTLRNLIQGILLEYSAQFQITDEIWRTIIDRALANMKVMTGEEFFESMHTISPELTIKSAFASLNGKVECECDKGHSFIMRAVALLRGNGCPACNKRMVTPEMLMENMSKMSPNLRLTEDFHRGMKKISVECTQCHRSFQANVTSLNNKPMLCLFCGQEEKERKRIEQNRKEFILRMESKRETNIIIDDIEKYTNSTSKLHWHCSTCGKTGFCTAGAILHKIKCCYDQYNAGNTAEGKNDEIADTEEYTANNRPNYSKIWNYWSKETK